MGAACAWVWWHFKKDHAARRTTQSTTKKSCTCRHKHQEQGIGFRDSILLYNADCIQPSALPSTHQVAPGCLPLHQRKRLPPRPPHPCSLLNPPQVACCPALQGRRGRGWWPCPRKKEQQATNSKQQQQQQATTTAASDKRQAASDNHQQQPKQSADAHCTQQATTSNNNPNKSRRTLHTTNSNNQQATTGRASRELAEGRPTSNLFNSYTSDTCMLRACI